MDGSVGTLDWADRTGGTLRLRDRGRLLCQLAMQLPLVPFEVLSRCGHTPRRKDLRSPDPPPSTPIARDAAEMCQAATAERSWVYAHSVRSFDFAQLFAQRAGVAFDPEVLWVAAMLHDIALGDGEVAMPGEPPCFTVRGASQARRLARQHHWTEQAEHRLAEAITLHINLRVPPRQGIEAHLLNLGTAVDVAGTRYSRIYSTAMKDVVDEQPRDAFEAVISQVWNTESGRAPRSRARFLRLLGLELLIRTSPLRHTSRPPGIPPLKPR